VLTWGQEEFIKDLRGAEGTCSPEELRLRGTAKPNGNRGGEEKRGGQSGPIYLQGGHGAFRKETNVSKINRFLGIGSGDRSEKYGIGGIQKTGRLLFDAMELKGGGGTQKKQKKNKQKTSVADTLY